MIATNENLREGWLSRQTELARIEVHLPPAACKSYQRLAALTGADPVELAERDVLGLLWELYELAATMRGSSDDLPSLYDSRMLRVEKALAACRKPEDGK